MQASFQEKEQHILQEGKKNDLRRENKNREDSFHSNTVYLHRKIPLFLWRQFFGSWQEGALMRAWRSADLSCAASRNPYITLSFYWHKLMQTGLKAASQRNPRCISQLEVSQHNLQILPFLMQLSSEHLEMREGRESSLAQDRDITEHQAGVPPPTILPWSLQADNNSFADYFYLFTVPGSVVGLGLWNQPPLALPAKP